MRGLWTRADAVVSAAVVRVEARAAIARRLRAREAALARSELSDRLDEIEIVGVDGTLVAAAETVADRYRLRALDALHLAAAHRVSDPTLVVATWDRELRAAAESAGLGVVPARRVGT